jgi:hypothetical protein
MSWLFNDVLSTAEVSQPRSDGNVEWHGDSDLTADGCGVFKGIIIQILK